MSELLSLAEDQELLAAIRRGESVSRRTWEAIFLKYREVVYHVIAKLLGDEHVAEDLTQDTFIQVHRFAGNYRGEGSLRSWIVTIAVNLARRHAVRRRAHQDKARERAVRNSTPSMPSETSDRVQAALAQLPLEQRTAIVLSCVEGISDREIAAILSCKEGTVWSRIYHAKRKLARLMGEPGTQDPGGS